MLTRNQAAVLAALEQNRQGLYGSDLVSNTKPKVGRGIVYTVLQDLVEAGWVREVEECPASTQAMELGLARTRHFITEQGRRMLTEHEAAVDAAPSLGGAPA